MLMKPITVAGESDSMGYICSSVLERVHKLHELILGQSDSTLLLDICICIFVL